MSFIDKYNIKKLKTSINKYGFKYSEKDFIIQSLLITISIIGIACLSKLNVEYVLILVLIGLLLTPIVLLAWFKQLYSIKRFTILSEYLTNIIPIFIQKTKIRYALGEAFTLVSDKMKDSVNKAIHYIDETKDDPNLNRNALKIIEDDFPNSRVKSVHKLLLNVEDSNSTNFRDIATNMYEDIEKWIKRVYAFQKDLKNRRNKLIVLCIMVLLMNATFTRLYTNNEFLNGFTDNALYQISTTIFIIVIFVIVVLILTKLNGEWLVEDIVSDQEEKLKKKYLFITKEKPKMKIIDILITLIFLACAILAWLLNQKAICVACIISSFVAYTNRTRLYKTSKRQIEKQFTIEFPMWLREVSLSLNNMTVLNAIEHTINTVSYPLRKEIRKFLKKANANPTSISPYVEFLEEYDIEEAKSSTKVLYAINNVSKSEIKNRISNLIVRNEELIAKAETIRNNDSIAGIEAIGYLPALLFSLQTIISMILVFTTMMNSIGGMVII